MRKHIIIPDVQVKPHLDYSWLRKVGKFIADQKPDVIICIGDFADMYSLSSYDIGKKSFEGRTYKDDIDSSYFAMNYLMNPIKERIGKLRSWKKRVWNPRLVMTLGNHEQRIEKAIDKDRKLEGLISIDDLHYKAFGWEVYPYLVPVIIDDVCYSHYFTSGVMGRPVASARQLVLKKHMSCVMGHVQNIDIDMSQRRADGTPLVGLFCGICTPYDEPYLNHQTNQLHRQIWIAEVENGFFIPQAIPLNKIVSY